MKEPSVDLNRSFVVLGLSLVMDSQIMSYHRQRRRYKESKFAINKFRKALEESVDDHC